MIASNAHLHARSRTFLCINPPLSPWPTPTLFFIICYFFHVIYYYLVFRWQLETKYNKTQSENVEKITLNSRRIGWTDDAVLSLPSAETIFTVMKLIAVFGLIAP